MAITDSRVRNGKLTFTCGTEVLEAACQTKNVMVDPDQDEGDRVEVLCGDTAGGGSTIKDQLHIESIQDFDNPAGLQAALWRCRGRTVHFKWQPNADATKYWEGDVEFVAPPVGGDVNSQLDYSLDLPILKYVHLPTGFGDGQIHPGEIIVATGVATTPVGDEFHLEPAGADVPMTLALLKAHAVIGDSGTAKPGGAWTTGQFLTLGDGMTKVHWDGTAWVAGAAS